MPKKNWFENVHKPYKLCSTSKMWLKLINIQSSLENENSSVDVTTSTNEMLVTSESDDEADSNLT